ncbi:histidine phosphatase family protein [Thioalkalivibrio sp.]|uniref:histidine phosphatase family protein n=1 Tax=Thioalkalivibrio sp. TaxID=2093813 RepID=UPI003564579F
MKTVRTTTPLAVASALVMLAGPSALIADEVVLWSALADGGKAVMIRHTQSEEATPEVSMHLSAEGDCAEEQNLSAEGREQARALGRLFEERGVAVDAVLSSEFCRARQTAEVAFGDYETWTPLNLIESLPAGESEWLMEDVRERIGEFAGDGVLVLVSHRSNINTITFQQTEPGDMAVVEPEGFGGFDVLGMISRK